VLGYDTAGSVDHGWGPRVLVFVHSDADVRRVVAAVDAGLPDTYADRPVRFGWDRVPARHWVTVTTLPAWLRDHLGVDASAGMSTVDWLVTPQQRLLGVVAGAVHADDDGTLRAVRERLTWYPNPVWRWLLACQWHRLAQEEAFAARAAEVGDDLGSTVTAGRPVRDLMRLALLLERRYAPYQKWLGTALARLPGTGGLCRQLIEATTATTLGAREDALAAAYMTLAERHNRAELTKPLTPAIGDSRPARVLMADRFADALIATVDDESLLRLPLIGGIDQHADSTDVLQDPDVFRLLTALYANEPPPGRDR
jgi:hypothetical protein